MSAVLTRLRDLFLAPSVPTAAPLAQAAEREVPRAIGVLGTGSSAAAAGAALALAAAGRAGSSAAVVCRWPADAADPGGLPGLPAARRLAARLDGRGLDVRATGRLVHVALPGDPALARAAAERAAAAAQDAPVVVVIAAARPAALDLLLAAQDRLVVVTSAAAPAVLTDLALEDAARVGRGAALLRLDTPGVLRLALAAGLGPGPALRGALRAALGA